MSAGARFQWMQDIASRIGNSTTWGVIPVVTEFPSDRSAGSSFVQQVASFTKLLVGGKIGVSGTASKSGLAIWINFPHIDHVPDTLGGIRTELVTEISIGESRVYNSNASTGFAPRGIGLHFDDVSEGVAKLLQNWRDLGVCDALRIRTISGSHEGWIPPDVRDGSEKFDMVWDAIRVGAVVSWPPNARCYPPVITIAGGNASITCPTTGTTIHYTTDSSYPDTDDAVYSTPVAVISGQTVTAVASKTNYDDSEVVRGTA